MILLRIIPAGNVLKIQALTSSTFHQEK